MSLGKGIVLKLVRRPFVWAVALSGLGLVLGVASAQATTITLSTHSSDETDPGVLDATLDFVITGASELTLTVTNDTPDYVINNVFFNGSTDVPAPTILHPASVGVLRSGADSAEPPSSAKVVASSLTVLASQRSWLN